MRRLISVFLMLCLLVGLLPAIPLKAEAAVEPTAAVSLWTDYAASSYAYGDGTSGNAYRISNAYQLARLAKRVNNGTDYKGVYFELLNDIDLSAYSWVPIGTTEDTPFRGHFYGNGFTISGLTLTADSTSGNCVGLFGYALGLIKEFNLNDVRIDTSYIQYVGSVVGVGGNCHSVNVSGNVSVRDSGSLYCGGIIGHTTIKDYDADNEYYVRYCSVYDCSFDGNISVTNITDANVGGIVSRGSSSLARCHSSGSITVSNAGTVIAGGLIGWSSTDTLTNSYSTMTVNAGGKQGTAGGLIGVSQGAVENCYATGSVSLTISAGGAGNGTSVSAAGGLVGTQYAGRISNCYTQNPSVSCTMTNATEQTYAGKLVGHGTSSELVPVGSCYVTARTTLKRNGFQDGGDCDPDSYPVITTADSTYYALETDTFTYSQDFITSTLG